MGPEGCRTRTRPGPRAFFVHTLFTTNRSTMDSPHQPDPKPRPLGNESPDPLAPAFPPGSLHDIVREEEEEEQVGGEPTPVLDDPTAAPQRED